MNKFIRDCFTTSDGVSWDLGRVLWAQAAITFMAIAAWSVCWNSAEFKAIDYGTGFAAILAAGGAALGFKAKSEIPPKDQT